MAVDADIARAKDVILKLTDVQDAAGKCQRDIQAMCSMEYWPDEAVSRECVNAASALGTLITQVGYAQALLVAQVIRRRELTEK